MEGWGHGSSSLIALPHGMEPAGCIATLALRAAPRDAPDPTTASTTGTSCPRGLVAADAGRPAENAEGAPAATALLFLILKSGKVLRFQARL